jgi:hypothetical protein
MAGRAYAWRMRVATANRERIAASLSAASRLPSACSQSRDSVIVLAADLNLRVCSLRYFSLFYSSTWHQSPRYCFDFDCARRPRCQEQRSDDGELGAEDLDDH